MRHFAVAIKQLRNREYATTGAHCWKNLGSALEELGRWEGSRRAYQRALELDPDLGEAHFALGLWYCCRSNNLSCALDHLEHVAKSPGSALSLKSVTGWKAKVLFQLELADQAFAAIRFLVDGDHLYDWQWPWCARLVREYGNRNIGSAAKALDFWHRFLKFHPSHIGGMAEEFRTLHFLHERGQNTGVDFVQFKVKGEMLASKEGTDHGLVWDWIGHWAEKDGDMTEAEAAFRKAFDSKPERFTCCLAGALNRMKRWSDALAVLLPNTEVNATKSTFWFRVAFAREHAGDTAGAVEAYARAIAIEPGYAVAHFNLGGVLWNSREDEAALRVWREALRLFPDHELAAKVRQTFPKLFGQGSTT